MAKSQMLAYIDRLAPRSKLLHLLFYRFNIKDFSFLYLSKHLSSMIEVLKTLKNFFINNMYLTALQVETPHFKNAAE